MVILFIAVTAPPPQNIRARCRVPITRTKKIFRFLPTTGANVIKKKYLILIK